MSDADLRRAVWMFRLISSPRLVDLGERLVRWGLKLHLPVKPLVRATLFRQFAGGETAEECLPVIEKLWQHHIATILDYSVEGQSTRADFERTVQEICKTIDLAARHEAIPFSVFKVSGLCRAEVLENKSPADEFEALKDRILRICTYAAERRVPVFIDAEESWIQDAIDELAETMMRRFNRNEVLVYHTIQLYRKGRLDYLKRLTKTARQEGFLIGVKLVRGAYLEKESARAQERHYPNPIQNSKEDTDRDFDLALTWCVENLDRVSVCAGTHNEASSLHLVTLMQRHAVAPSDRRVWFSQLLGMSDHISFNLAAAGYNVAKYVPYAPIEALIPYLVRRARENTAVRGQTGRELKLLQTEMHRRRKNFRNQI